MASSESASAQNETLGVRGRLGIAGVVLLVEYLFISLRFDALTVSERGGVWSWVGRVGSVSPLAVAVVTALLLLRKDDGFFRDLAPSKPSRVLLVLHAAFYAAFLFVTARVFGREEAPPGSAIGWLLLFFGLAIATGSSLLVGLAGRQVVVRAASWSVVVGSGIGFLAWLAGQFTTELWTVVSKFTLTVVAAMLRLVVTGVSVDLHTLALRLEDFEVLVSSECSGLEGVGLVTVLLAAYLIAFRERFRVPQALLLLPIGAAAVWLGNSLRIAILMLVGAYVDAELAYGGFHSKLGWVLFCAATLAVAALAERTRFFRAVPEEEAGERLENPTAAYLMPVLALNATALVTAMFTKDIDHLYGLRLLAAVAALVAYREAYRDLPRSGSLLPLGVGVLVGALWVLTAPKGGESEAIEVSWVWLTTRALGSVLFVPLVEELAFRGCLLRWLISRDFTSVPLTRYTPWAILGSSLVFGVLHERWVSATLVGAVYAAMQLRRGSLLDAILAHAATNAVVTIAVLWTGNLSLWS